MALSDNKLDYTASLEDINNTIQAINNSLTSASNDLLNIINDASDNTVTDTSITNLISNISSIITEKDNKINDLINEMAGKVTPAGTAVAGDVTSGKTFINSTGKTLTGTMTNQGSKTYNPSTATQTGGAGYYSSITVNKGFVYTTSSTSISSSSSSSYTYTTINHGLGRTPNHVFVIITNGKFNTTAMKATYVVAHSKKGDLIVCCGTNTSYQHFTINISSITSSSFRVGIKSSTNSSGSVKKSSATIAGYVVC